MNVENLKLNRFIFVFQLKHVKCGLNPGSQVMVTEMCDFHNKGHRAFASSSILLPSLITSESLEGFIYRSNKCLNGYEKYFD